MCYYTVKLLEASKRLSLDKNLSERIREANVSLHHFEAKYYEQLHPEIYNRHEQKRLQSALEMVDKLVAVTRPRTKKAFDVGAGTGNLTGKLLQMGYHVTALDLSVEMCEILEKKYRSYLESQKLVIVNSPIEDVSFGRGEFDLITCYSVLHHLPDYVDVVQRFSGFLKKGGVMYLDHEASPFYWKNEATSLADVVKIVYFHSNLLFNALYFRVAGMNVPALNYDLSDYWHNKEHPLDHGVIQRVFEREQFDFFERTDYYVKFRTWVPNPLFYVYLRMCKPEMSFWVAKK
jgi:2-polyprenyl-3-methyl-5-hydroxy-6-metoxy-1,4-benzoquinol methylase